MPALKIADLDHAPVVGEKYLARCVKCEDEPFNEKYGWGHMPWTPCIGIPHNDFEYDFGDFMHLHYDYRFMPDAQLSYFEERSKDEEYAKASSLLWAMDAAERQRPKYRWIELTCCRDMPIHKVDSCGFMLWTLQPVFKDKVLDLKNPVCPHRKVCLKNMPVQNGAIVCPAHGLHFDAETGKMIQKKLKPWMKA